jgi:hypothetical protein
VHLINNGIIRVDETHTSASGDNGGIVMLAASDQVDEDRNRDKYGCGSDFLDINRFWRLSSLTQHGVLIPLWSGLLQVNADGPSTHKPIGLATCLLPAGIYVTD